MCNCVYSPSRYIHFLTVDDEGTFNILRYAEVEYVSQDVCNQWLSKINEVVADGHICAG